MSESDLQIVAIILFLVLVAQARLAFGTCYASPEREHRTTSLLMWSLVLVVTLCIGLNFLSAPQDFAVPGVALCVIALTALIACYRGFIFLNDPQQARHLSGVLGVSLLVVIQSLALAFLSAFQQSSDRNYSTDRCRNNLKYIALAMQNYADHEGGEFPSAITGDDPNLVSWRVSLLPYADNLSLYEAYDKSAAWDAPENLTIGQTSMFMYACPLDNSRQESDGQGRRFTSYAVVTGEHSSVRRRRGRNPKLDFPDGLSDTILAVEACGQKIVWTEPRDIDLSQKPLILGGGDHTTLSDALFISGFHPRGIHVAMADGSVRAIPRNIDAAVLKAMLTAEGND